MTDNGLSPQGQQRRREILALALEEARRLQYHRKRHRRLSGAVGVLLIVTVLWVLFWPTERTTDHRQAIHNHDVIPRSSPSFDLERHIVRNEVDDLTRYLVITREEFPADVLVDDAELLGTLAELGRTEGIVRAGGHTWLTSDLDSGLGAWE